MKAPRPNDIWIAGIFIADTVLPVNRRGVFWRCSSFRYCKRSSLPTYSSGIIMYRRYCSEVASPQANCRFRLLTGRGRAPHPPSSISTVFRTASLPPAEPPGGAWLVSINIQGVVPPSPEWLTGCTPHTRGQNRRVKRDLSIRQTTALLRQS
jgi:hypothetical protein